MEVEGEEEEEETEDKLKQDVLRSRRHAVFFLRFAMKFFDACAFT